MRSPERPAEGLEQTFRLLAKTQNEAAISVLIPALDSSDVRIQEGALRAILDRRSPVGQREVLKRLHTAADRFRPIIDERRGRMSFALRDGLLGTDNQMCINACQAIVWFREYDLVPALLTALEDETNPNADLAAQTLVSLVDLLYEELSAPPAGAHGRDPQTVRNHVIGALEAAVRSYVKHRRSEVVNAFLVLANRDNATLKQILQDPHHAAYLALVDGLLHNQRGGVVRLVLSFLEDPHAPSAALSVLARRSDSKFIGHLLRKIGFEPSAVAAQNLKRLDHIIWLKTDGLLDSLDDAAQHSLVQLVMATGAKRLEVFKTIEHLLTTGKPGGRRAAARALAKFSGAEANAAALLALGDNDPAVQAAVLAQLRQRGIPGALTRLVEMVDSPHEVVRHAARESLAEFNFDRYLAAFDMLDEEVRRTTGALVKKINPQAIPALAEAMQARSRTRRLRAVAVAAAMGAIDELESSVLELLADDDHLVRAEAARVLAGCRSSAVRSALHEALSDRSVVVKQMAEQSLKQIAEEDPSVQTIHPSEDAQATL